MYNKNVHRGTGIPMDPNIKDYVSMSIYHTPEVFDSLKSFIVSEEDLDRSTTITEAPWNKGLPSEYQPRYNTSYPKLSKARKLIQSNNSKGRIWLTNGIECVQVKKNNIWKYLNLGFYIGRVLARKKKTHKALYGSCVICKRFIQVNNLTNHYRFTHLDSQ